MTKTAATAAFGTLLKIGDGGSPTENFTTVAEVRNIQGPAMKVDLKDASSHTSTGAYKEMLPVMKEGGEIKFECNFLPQNATQSYTAGFLRDFDNRTLRNYQLVFTDLGATTWKVSAYVATFDAKEPLDDILRADVGLHISGQPILA